MGNAKALECKRKRVLSAQRYNLSESKCMEVGLPGYQSKLQIPSPVAKYISTSSSDIYICMYIYIYMYICIHVYTHTHLFYT